MKISALSIGGLREYRTRLFPLVRKVAGLSLARAASSVALGIALVLATRWTDPSVFGEFAVALSVIHTIAGILAFGLPAFTLRAAVLGRDAAVQYALFLNLATSIVAAVLGFAIAARFVSVNWYLLLLLVISIAFEKNAEARIGLGTEFGTEKLVNNTLVIRGLAALAAFLVLISLRVQPILAYALSRAVIIGITTIILELRIRNWPLTWHRPPPGELESLGGFGVANCVASAQQLDVTLVSAAANATTAGMYAAAQKLSLPLALLTRSISVVIMGPAARGGTAKAKTLVRHLVLLSIAGLALFGLVAIWSRPLVSLILGPAYAAATPAFAAFLLTVPALTAAQLLMTILQANNLANSVAINTTIVTAITLIAIPLGAHLAGVVGASIALGITTWLRLAGLCIVSRKLA